MENKIIITGWDEEGDDVEIILDYDTQDNVIGFTTPRSCPTCLGQVKERTSILVEDLTLAIHQLRLEE